MLTFSQRRRGTSAICALPTSTAASRTAGIPPHGSPHDGRYLVFDLGPSYSVFDHFEAVKGHVVGNVTRFAGRAIGKFRPNSDPTTEFQTETLPKSHLLSDKSRSSAAPTPFHRWQASQRLGGRPREHGGGRAPRRFISGSAPLRAQWCARDRELYPCRRRVSSPFTGMCSCKEEVRKCLTKWLIHRLFRVAAFFSARPRSRRRRAVPLGARPDRGVRPSRRGLYRRRYPVNGEHSPRLMVVPRRQPRGPLGAPRFPLPPAPARARAAAKSGRRFCVKACMPSWYSGPK